MDWPHTLVGKLGIDLTDLSFWHEGLGAIEDLITRAEELAATVSAGQLAGERFPLALRYRLCTFLMRRRS